MRHAGNGNESLFSAGFIIPVDVRAATSVKLHMSNCPAQPVYSPKMDDPNRKRLRERNSRTSNHGGANTKLVTPYHDPLFQTPGLIVEYHRVQYVNSIITPVMIDSAF
ncbi:hypothetical protein ATANTOWER_007690 [Ataeniobius toweri]|uniref:Uncharacterized protein n=1 Tax=Ataeniobius toweri TaxID=208326 RepID=A0ABU7CG56_9TELE|nr:hypothetical protein [Ataeniobius toweri]